MNKCIFWNHSKIIYLIIIYIYIYNIYIIKLLIFNMNLFKIARLSGGKMTRGCREAL